LISLQVSRVILSFVNGVSMKNAKVYQGFHDDKKVEEHWYRVVFLYRFWITKIFQTSILFETNKFDHGGPPCCGGPVQLPPLPPLNPALVLPMFHQIKETVHTD